MSTQDLKDFKYAVDVLEYRKRVSDAKLLSDLLYEVHNAMVVMKHNPDDVYAEQAHAKLKYLLEV